MVGAADERRPARYLRSSSGRRDSSGEGIAAELVVSVVFGRGKVYFDISATVWGRVLIFFATLQYFVEMYPFVSDGFEPDPNTWGDPRLRVISSSRVEIGTAHALDGPLPVPFTEPPVAAPAPAPNTSASGSGTSNSAVSEIDLVAR